MAKKRANGEGNIRKRKDGRWEGRYTAGYDAKTGKRIIKNVLGKTQAEVKEKLKKALEECQGLDVSRSEEYTVATWLRTWYELYAKPNVRTATANRYELIIETYTIPRIGHIKLKKLTTRHLQKLYKELLESGRIHIGKNQDTPTPLARSRTKPPPPWAVSWNRFDKNRKTAPDRKPFFLSGALMSIGSVVSFPHVGHGVGQKFLDNP